MSDKITPVLWFDRNGEEAANFYVSLLPDSRIDRVTRAPADYPSGSEGDVITVDFTLAGRRYQALNGGPNFKFNEAVSFMIHCRDQAEVDRLWDALTAGGGQPVQCGWLKDRYGLFWQICPEEMLTMLASDDRAAARRAFEAMMGMVKLDLAELRKAYEG
ncbi:MAG TPA: VOC family protein [Allosphingosinicella sp.]|jgi:predicted 3-demethylubiquinone-9 3-methyltransferase (glyoxalase superfamily)|nr:VOC family protein [Allosphingosinicella sp.]